MGGKKRAKGVLINQEFKNQKPMDWILGDTIISFWYLNWNYSALYRKNLDFLSYQSVVREMNKFNPNTHNTVSIILRTERLDCNSH